MTGSRRAEEKMGIEGEGAFSSRICLMRENKKAGASPSLEIQQTRSGAPTFEHFLRRNSLAQ